MRFRDTGMRGPFSARWLVEDFVFSDLKLFDFCLSRAEVFSPTE